MWIRSQDRKKLIKCSDIFIRDTKIFNIGYKHVTIVGEYSTEEQAMKVLDMIQESLLKQDKHFGDISFQTNIDGEIVTQETIVFQMPLDEEVETA